MSGDQAGTAAASTSIAAPSGDGGVSKAYLAVQGLTALTQVLGGFSSSNANRAEASALEQQADIALADAQILARQRAYDARRFQASQGSAYLNAGVTLEGTPVIVMEDTRAKAQEEVDAIMRRGYAQQNLYRTQAQMTRNKGRSSFISGILGAVGTGAETYLKGKQEGMWGSGNALNPATPLPPSYTPNPKL